MPAAKKTGSDTNREVSERLAKVEAEAQARRREVITAPGSEWQRLQRVRDNGQQDPTTALPQSARTAVQERPTAPIVTKLTDARGKAGELVLPHEAHITGVINELTGTGVYEGNHSAASATVVQVDRENRGDVMVNVVRPSRFNPPAARFAWQAGTDQVGLAIDWLDRDVIAGLRELGDSAGVPVVVVLTPAVFYDAEPDWQKLAELADHHDVTVVVIKVDEGAKAPRFRARA